MNDLKFTTAGDYMKMNERIKQFAQQAGFKVDWQHADVQDIKMARFEKFAELIMAECIGIVENLSPGYKDYRDQIEDAFRRDCVIEIKKHFGVE
jgi:hypothetical protein